uniref:Uncharacterized protein n=1 Tax=Zea mays TaxID=4577 RepID=B6SYN4_MAIZE|nr:hypothetical protein [Zea mays]
MALVIKSAIIAVFLVLGAISYTSVYCIGTGIGTEDTPAPKPKPGMPCFHAGTSQYPCTTDGCRRLCEHQHHRSDKAYCKSISPGECCCPNE